MDEAKLCTKCGKKLRSNNTKGVCSGGCAEPSSEPTNDADEHASRYRAKRRKELDRKFRDVAAALDFDADEIMEEYQESWLTRIKERAKPPVEDLA